jgi:nicotinamidase-related amidase
VTLTPCTGDTFESSPNLASELKALGVEEIIAFGIQSECCVESTCNGALAAEFKVSLLSGAHSTYDSAGKTAEEIERDVEERLRLKGVNVVPWEEAVDAWATNMRLSR